MPAYDYTCQKCGADFMIRASMSAYSEGLDACCPECDSKDVERTFTAVNVVTSHSTSGSAGDCSTGFT